MSSPLLLDDAGVGTDASARIFEALEDELNATSLNNAYEDDVKVHQRKFRGLGMASFGGCLTRLRIAPSGRVLREQTGAALGEFHTLPTGQAVSEPIFVPTPGTTAEDDGWLLTVA